MATRIDDLSIFGDYKSEENKLTAAILQILRRGGERLIREFSAAAGFVLPDNEIDILSQVTEDGCTPDGLKRSQFSFSLYVESKVVPNAINKRQLSALVRLQERRDDATILYITPDLQRPAHLEGEPVAWMSWLRVRDALVEYLETREGESDDVLAFLVDHFSTFAARLGVLGQSWEPPAGSVLVVPAKNTWHINDEYRLYVCQNRRSFRPSEWIAFYVNGEIRRVYKIEGEPEQDVIPASDPLLSTFFGKSPYRSNAQEPHMVMRLGERRDVGPVKNDSVDHAGRPCAFVQGQRYTTMAELESAARTSDL